MRNGIMRGLRKQRIPPLGLGWCEIGKICFDLIRLVIDG